MDSEMFCLVWCTSELIALSNALQNFMAQQAAQEVIKWGLQHFLYTGLVAAASLPLVLISAAQVWFVLLQAAQLA